MAFELDIGFNSLAGKKPINEDFCAAMLPQAGQEAFGAICAIADGVSTGGMGREAAQTTVTSLVRDYFGTRDTWDTTVALDRVISAQNTWLEGINRRRKPLLGLTTLTALVLRGQTYTLAHIGDTRAYLLRGGEFIQLTQDHVMDHPDFRHKLLRCIGAQERLVMDYSQGDLAVGDVFALTTDGVHGFIRDKQLEKFAHIESAQDMADAIAQAALVAGSHDNASALVVRVLGVSQGDLHDDMRRALALPILPKRKVGDTIDALLVTALVADTGVNLLYQVRDPVTQTLYALKTLHPARAHDTQERAMLAHEAWLAKRMASADSSEHWVRVHDRPPSGAEPSAYYLLYDWHSGDTLQQMLDHKTPVSTAQALVASTQALKALGRLHRQSVIHRDIKPANVHWGSDGVLRILDLGVALSGSAPQSARNLHAGTPSYINPEQWGFSLGKADAEPAPADAGSDLFAWGVTLYQLLTGRLPYGQVLAYQSGRYFKDPTPPSRSNPEVPIWLDHIVLKAVARDYKMRFETAEEFLLAIERGASRPLSALPATPLSQRDPALVWKLGVALSVLLNLLLVYWLLFLPK
jgi:serine/threonine protein phosphatase PrpC